MLYVFVGEVACLELIVVVSHEFEKCTPDAGWTRRTETSLIVEPIPYAGYESLRVVPVDGDVRVGEVGNCCLVPVAFCFEDKALFSFVALEKEVAPDVDAEFKWHVESKVLTNFARLDTGQIVNRVPRFFDEPDDFIDARSTRV